MMTSIIGVDPGLDGALALVTDGRLVAVEDMPVIEEDGKTRLSFDANGIPVEKHGTIRTMDAAGVKLLFESFALLCGEVHIVMERTGPRPEQGLASTAKSMFAAGEISGIAVGMGWPRTFVAANKWKSDMGVSADKDTSLRRIKELAPDMAAKFARKKDNGRAEAALIALWGWRIIHGR